MHAEPRSERDRIYWTYVRASAPLAVAADAGGGTALAVSQLVVSASQCQAPTPPSSVLLFARFGKCLVRAACIVPQPSHRFISSSVR